MVILWTCTASARCPLPINRAQGVARACSGAFCWSLGRVDGVLLARPAITEQLLEGFLAGRENRLPRVGMLPRPKLLNRGGR